MSVLQRIREKAAGRRREIFFVVSVVLIVVTCWVTIAYYFFQPREKYDKKIILVSAKYPPEDMKIPGEVYFTMVEMDDGDKPINSRLLDKVNIRNRSKNELCKIRSSGKTGNLIKAHEKNKYFYLDQGWDETSESKYESFYCFPIEFNKNNKRLSTGKFRSVDYSLFDVYPTDIDYREENLICEMGIVLPLQKLKSPGDLIRTGQFQKTKDILSYLNKCRLAECKNTKFLDEKTVVAQGMDGKQNNYIVFSSTDSDKCFVFREGFYSHRQFLPDVISPIDVSPDKRKVAFLASEKMKTRFFGDVILYVWTTGENKASKIVKLCGVEGLSYYANRPEYMKWNPVNSNLIAIYNSSIVNYGFFESLDEDSISILRKHTDYGTERIWNFLSPQSRDFLNNWNPERCDESEKKPIIKELNGLAGRRDFCDKRIVEEADVDVLRKKYIDKGINNLSEGELRDLNLHIMRQFLPKWQEREDAIYIVNIENRDTQVFWLPQPPESNRMKNFRWSPDGKRLAIIDCSGRIFIYNVQSKKLTQIANKSEYFDLFWVE